MNFRIICRRLTGVRRVKTIYTVELQKVKKDVNIGSVKRNMKDILAVRAYGASYMIEGGLHNGSIVV